MWGEFKDFVNILVAALAGMLATCVSFAFTFALIVYAGAPNESVFLCVFIGLVVFALVRKAMS